MSRPNKPTALKLIEGEKNKERINKNEPKPRPKAPGIPRHIDPIARREWKRIGSALERLGILTEIDGDSFATYCGLIALEVRLWMALKEAEYKMLAYKHTVDGAGNEHIEVKLNPIIMGLRQVALAKRPYIAEFGMGPASRGKISVPGIDDGEFEDLLD